MKRIFISYSHKDKVWKDRLLTQLNVLALEGCYDVWDDRRIEIGDDWLPEIELALKNAQVAILMVSANFLTSNFIRKTEVPKIMERRENEGLIVIPVIVKPCAWKKVPWLSTIQAYPEGGKALTTFRKNQAEEKLAELAEKLDDIVKDIETKPEEPTPSTPSHRLKKKKTILLTSLPSRKIDLIGRQKELKWITQQLHESKRVLLVNGLGGIGKTEVCKRFFLDHYKEFAYAGWIDYLTSIKESLVNAFGFSPDLVKMNEADTLDERYHKILVFLNSLESNSLLVFDNIEDPEDDDLDTLTRLPFKVIANSRSVLPGLLAYTLDFLTEAFCRDLFYEYYKIEKNDDRVNKIVERCGRHTLTVELLARTAQNAAMSVASFYELLKKKGFNLNDVIGDKVHTFWHDEKTRKRFFDHLLKIFDISAARVTEIELQVLTNLSVLPAIYIPMETIKEWLKLETNEEINGLVSKGWLKRDRTNIFMHQVIQEVIRYKTHPDVGKCKNLIVSLKWKLFLKPGENPLDKKKYVIYADSLLQHIHDFHEDAATLANNLSWIYKALGQLEPALEFQLKDVKISEKILDKNHPDLATSYHNLSTIYLDMKQYSTALEYAQKAVAILQYLFPNGHPNLDTFKKNLEEIRKRA
ncbi:MAG: TIR domain-containing protein [Candidatus Aminicenantes bacterium]|nr:TIR domain-containing protein [Candidatus Aminicenantes bacterium]NIM83143.1 TIR domain-containing protein [Candidatus Aminicenantes bacterium]NIN17465.1 TIR domain-containing protein [Candidatus Aminicenantes bacterium]NIN41361.1 TIR domain-containing protein [Candidatus Aminicenantes bacterium]NIN89129.1 TIR domain-containing protein [Candidatus Aminicenantes bacterium]